MRRKHSRGIGARLLNPAPCLPSSIPLANSSRSMRIWIITTPARPFAACHFACSFHDARLLTDSRLPLPLPAFLFSTGKRNRYYVLNVCSGYFFSLYTGILYRGIFVEMMYGGQKRMEESGGGCLVGLDWSLRHIFNSKSTGIRFFFRVSLFLSAFCWSRGFDASPTPRAPSKFPSSSS